MKAILTQDRPENLTLSQWWEYLRSESAKITTVKNQLSDKERNFKTDKPL